MDKMQLNQVEVIVIGEMRWETWNEAGRYYLRNDGNPFPHRFETLTARDNYIRALRLIADEALDEKDRQLRPGQTW